MFNITTDITMKDIINHNLIIFNVAKEEILNKDIRRINKVIEKLEKCKLSSRRKLTMFFDGYDDVPEEIYEIEPIRDWVAKLFRQQPHFFYFIHPFENISSLLACCLGDIITFSAKDKRATQDYDILLLLGLERPMQKVRLEVPTELANRIISATHAYGKKIGDSPEVIDEILGGAIPNYVSKNP